MKVYLEIEVSDAHVNQDSGTALACAQALIRRAIDTEISMFRCNGDASINLNELMNVYSAVSGMVGADESKRPVVLPDYDFSQKQLDQLHALFWLD